MGVDYREQYKPEHLEPFFPNEIVKMIIVVLCTLPPICDFAGPLPRVELCNTAIRALGADYAGDDGVLVADLSEAFAKHGDDVCHLINPGGIHPTREGYELIADTIFEQLTRVTW